MRLFSTLCLVFVFGISAAQIPPGYYDDAAGLSGEQLKEALHDIIKGHNSISYSALWTAFESTDKKSNGKVWDIYSDVPGGNPPYEFTFFSDQCGNYGQEGDCYNREHSFPKSWFGGEVLPMYTDLYHVYPTDGYVNGKRANYPYGEVGSASWTSENGSRLGNSVTPGYSQTVFEPIDAYKGDLARTYFYMAVRYFGEDGGWPGSPMVNGAQPEDWALDMLYEWHLEDPVSQKEMGRNDAIYDYQNNRNPFIDHPEYVEEIWFTTTISNDIAFNRFDLAVYPNPVEDFAYVHLSESAAGQDISFKILDQTGRIVMTQKSNGSNRQSIDVSDLQKGLYYLMVFNNQNHYSITRKIVR